MARRSENRERGHVRAEEREQEHEWTKRPARQEVVFSFFFAFRMTKSKDADIENGREIQENYDCGNQRVASSLVSVSSTSCSR